jgi:hypothetical protein
MYNDFIDNDEILYRRIPAWCEKSYEIQEDGTIKIDRSAFFDRGMKISVDRAKLCNNNPRYTLGNQVGVVVSLVAGQVRKADEEEDLTRNDSKGNPIQFRIDIEPAPLPTNPAHAQIFSIPEFVKADNGKTFRKLTRYLARLAEQGVWVEFLTCE